MCVYLRAIGEQKLACHGVGEAEDGSPRQWAVYRSPQRRCASTGAVG